MVLKLKRWHIFLAGAVLVIFTVFALFADFDTPDVSKNPYIVFDFGLFPHIRLKVKKLDNDEFLYTFTSASFVQKKKVKLGYEYDFRMYKKDPDLKVVIPEGFHQYNLQPGDIVAGQIEVKFAPKHFIGPMLDRIGITLNRFKVQKVQFRRLSPPTAFINRTAPSKYLVSRLEDFAVYKFIAKSKGCREILDWKGFSYWGKACNPVSCETIEYFSTPADVSTYMYAMYSAYLAKATSLSSSKIRRFLDYLEQSYPLKIKKGELYEYKDINPLLNYSFPLCPLVGSTFDPPEPIKELCLRYMERFQVSRFRYYKLKPEVTAKVSDVSGLDFFFLNYYPTGFTTRWGTLANDIDLNCYFYLKHGKADKFYYSFSKEPLSDPRYVSVLKWLIKLRYPGITPVKFKQKDKDLPIEYTSWDGLLGFDLTQKAYVYYRDTGLGAYNLDGITLSPVSYTRQRLKLDNAVYTSTLLNTIFVYDVLFLKR